MPGTAFSAQRYQQNGDTVLALYGDINRAAEEGLQAAYQAAKDGGGRLLLDFTGVDYINSTGIALIVRILADCRMSARDVAAFGLTQHYREIFSITRLSDFMAIYDDEQTALAAH